MVEKDEVVVFVLDACSLLTKVFRVRKVKF